MNRYSVCVDEFAEHFSDWREQADRLIKIERDEWSATYSLEQLLEAGEVHRITRICNEFLERVK